MRRKAPILNFNRMPVLKEIMGRPFTKDERYNLYMLYGIDYLDISKNFIDRVAWEEWVDENTILIDDTKEISDVEKLKKYGIEFKGE